MTCEKKRRENGTGAVQYRNGRYELCVDLGKDENGKRIRKCASGKTMKEAKSRVQEKIRLYYTQKNMDILNSTVVINDETQSISELIIQRTNKHKLYDIAIEYINEYKRMNIKNGSLTAYRTRMNYLENFFKNKNIEDVTPGDIRKMLREMAEDNNNISVTGRALSKASIQSELTFLKNVFNFAQKELHIMEKDLFKEYNITVPQRASKREKVHEIEPDVYMKYLKLSEKNDIPILYTAFIIMLFTGVRIGELCGLQMKDCHQEEGYIEIKRAISNQMIVSEDLKQCKANYVVSSLKTESSHRLIPCDHIVFEKIEVLHNAYKKTKIWNKAKENGYQDFIFLSRDGKFHTPQSLYAQLKRFMSDNHLPNITFHQFRHTFATTLVRNGAVLRSVSCLLGHSDPSLVLRVYSDTNEKDKREAVKIANTYYHRLMEET